MPKWMSSVSVVLLASGAVFAIWAAATGRLMMGPAPARSEQPVLPEAAWAAAAPGRVEPKGGELYIGAPAPAVIREVPIKLNDRVKGGDLLIRLDDEEIAAKLSAAKAEAAVRAAERDALGAAGPALERRKAEDALYLAERIAFDARMELDRLILLAGANLVSNEDVEKARASIVAANDRLDQERANLKRLQSKNYPPLTREEAALAAARAEVSAISVALERMHIRAPTDGFVLDLNARSGEIPRTDRPLVVLGETSQLQVRAEVEERDVSKIYLGQLAVVKSSAFPGRVFEARVSVIAKALGSPKLGSRGRRQIDVDVLEVVLDLEAGTPLLPGMRTDVLFREMGAAQKSSMLTTP